ncbi:MULTISPECIES: HEAT repeat domain-containing protein [Hymenobacter]|uniref:HEAT repeat domain-containing protein n=1 Tax=Hymenobacter jejuensis TaxID=2502781 RepID=A0A5B7ZYM2_9BACT|nr:MULTISPECIES: HEAT repeat domain-containing protein [Hymenobacter]MBC6992411.1 HEAT repeat domain-containing protein [Hymenobacter sp. BT491]QDA60294.1 HEAT repeat domain-containing protein [Hymenobacter jejuensis]
MSDVNTNLRNALDLFWKYVAHHQGATSVEEVKVDFWDDDQDTPERRALRNNLLQAVAHEIELQNWGKGDVAGIDLLLEAITADYLHEEVLYDCLEHLRVNCRTLLMTRGMLSPLHHTRYLMAEHVAQYNVPDRSALLEFLICHDDHKLVIRYALNSLSDLHPAQAVPYALERLADEDEYIRLSSVLALQAARQNLPVEVIKPLLNDPSEYVRDVATVMVQRA